MNRNSGIGDIEAVAEDRGFPYPRTDAEILAMRTGSAETTMIPYAKCYPIPHDMFYGIRRPGIQDMEEVEELRTREWFRALGAKTARDVRNQVYGMLMAGGIPTQGDGDE